MSQQPQPTTTILLTEDELARLREEVDQRLDSLVLYARSRCSAPEDVVQEALVDLVKLRALPENVGAWLYQAVRWRAANQRRSDKRNSEKLDAVAQQQENWFEPLHSFKHASTIDPDDLQAALERLPELDREIVVLKTWGSLPLTEIASQLGISKSNAHRKYWDAIRQLKQQLELEAQVDTTTP